MSRKHKFHNPDGVYFVTFAVVGWIDAFTRNLYREIFIDSLKHYQTQKDWFFADLKSNLTTENFLIVELEFQNSIKNFKA